MMNSKITKNEKIFHILNAVFMILFCAAMLYPMLYVLGHSMMGDVERSLYPLRVFPRNADWSGYKYIFAGSRVLDAYIITILRTVVGTLFNIVLTAMLAYPLSKKYYPGRTFLTLFISFTMWFAGGMIPNFLLIKSLGLIDNFWVYILPTMINPFFLIILRNFFMQIPESLEESARLDGANDFTILIRIIMPLSMASIATISLFYAVFHWNTWWDAMLYVNKRELWTLQYVLQQLISSSSFIDIAKDNSALMELMPPAESVKMACIVIATVPILCVYPFLQKYFVKGVIAGSIKG